MDELGGGNVVAGEADLPDRTVYPDDRVASRRKHTCNGDAGAAAEIEHAGTTLRGKPPEQF